MPPVAAQRLRFAAAALAALLAAPAAQAQLTADAVWQAWQEYSALAGQTMQAGSLSRDGATLTASKVRIESGADDILVAVALDSIAFTEQADGTVAVAMPDAYDMVMTGDMGQRVVLNLRHPGLRLSVAEAPDGLVHSLAAPEMSMALAELEGPGEAPEAVVAQITALGVTGRYNVPVTPGGASNTELAIGALNAGLEIRQSNGEHVDIDYAATGVTLNAGGAGLDQMARMEEGDLAGALADGLSIALSLGYDTLRYSFDIDADGNEAAGGGTAIDGDTRFVLNRGEFSFRSGSRNTEINVSGSELPMGAISLKASELGYGFSLPVSGAPTPQPASLLLRLVDLILPDEVWGMADPTGQIQRGPATLVLDLAAQLMLPSDLFGMETMFGYMFGGPLDVVQPAALEIRALQLRAAGAELTGDGSFTFDASDMETIPGVPRPTGVLNLALRGGTQLLDTLVAMGLVPPDQAQGARMMLALFARPGSGPDELVSKLELREDGSIFANDMRIQ
jgi:hypothetical protein